MPDKQFTRTLSSCSMPYDTRHLIQVLGSGSWISSGPRIRSSTSEPRYMTWYPWGHYWMKRLILRWSALDKSGFSSANVCLPAVFLLPSYGDVRDWLILLTYVGLRWFAYLPNLPTNWGKCTSSILDTENCYENYYSYCNYCTGYYSNTDSCFALDHYYDSVSCYCCRSSW